MKTNKLFLIIFVLISLILVGCTQEADDEVDVILEIDSDSELMKGQIVPVEVRSKFSELPSEAELKQTLERLKQECLKIEIPPYECFASASKDKSYCDNMVDIDEKNDCFVKVTKDVSYCEKFSEQKERDYCFAITTLESSHCEKLLEQDYKLFCLAESNSNFSYCEQISNQEEKSFCLAKLTDDSSYCANIIDIFEKNYCMAVSTQDSFYCQRMIEDVCYAESFSQIYQNLFLNKEISAFCDKITEIKVEEACYEGLYNAYIILGREDISYCEKLPNKELKNLCYYNGGTNDMNIDYCNKIQNSDMKNSCLGIVQMNIETCKSITNEDLKYSCIVQLIEQSTEVDTSACDFLSDSEMVENCLAYFG